MVSLAAHILDTKAGRFDPAKFKDEYELALRKLVKRKAAGKTIEAPEEREDRSNVIDLMEALRQSVKGKGRKAAALRTTFRQQEDATSPARARGASARRPERALSRDAHRRRRLRSARPSPIFRSSANAGTTGETGDLSLKMLLAARGGLALWMVYGFMRADVVIIVANAVSLTLLGGIIYFKLRGREAIP